MQQLIPRKRLQKHIEMCLTEAPVTVLLGGRQTGKTTLARIIAQDRAQVTVFDLEQVAGRQALATTPELTLSSCTGLVVIDEVQRIPEIFEMLRPICDNPANKATFLLLGSASLDIVRGVSETLAGRAYFVHIPGLGIDEVGADKQERLWFQGGLPRAFLADGPQAAGRWLDNFAVTFLERDIPLLHIRIPAETLRRFWTMLAHYHGQTWNASELAQSMSVSPTTATHYRDILSGSFAVRVLPPWHENLKKRQVKSPKVFIRDTGILHALLGIDSMHTLRAHPRYGASWEGFGLEQVLIRLGDRDAYFWRTQRGAELDLLLLKRGKRWGFEFKCSDAPMMTKAMHTALSDLSLERLWVLYPGSARFPLHERAEALPLAELEQAARFIEGNG